MDMAIATRAAAMGRLWSWRMRQLPHRRALRVACSAAEAPPSLRLVSTSPEGTQLLAHYLASDLRPSDCYLLRGEVGSGKTFFCRAFIRAAAEEEDLPVPSPTFLLQNIYDSVQGTPIHHFDLYRLTDPRDLARLDLPASFAAAASLIEWAERLGGQLPSAHLGIAIQLAEQAEVLRLQRQGARAPEHSKGSGAEAQGTDEEEESDARWRSIALTPHGGAWRRRLAELESFLRQHGPEHGLWLGAAER